MNKVQKLLLLTILVGGLMFGTAAGQYHSEGVKGGINLGVLAGMTDVEKNDDLEIGPQGRVFVRYPLIGGLVQGEFGLTSGVLNGMDYKTHVLPIDYRFLLSPLKFESFNPFLYAGVGLLSFENKEVASQLSNLDKKNNYTGVVPLGLGLQFKVSESTAFEISGGYNYSFTDKLDFQEVGSNTSLNNDFSSNKDGFLSLAAGLTLMLENPNGDPDMDGLTNKMEKELGTNKKVADSDGDGLSDGEEYNQYKTNPLIADSDQDGLSDGDEVKKYRTNPLKADTDGDGLSDSDEINKHKTDPTKADSDGDGLSDSDELNKHKTDPLKPDSDMDGLKDGDEISKHKTDPLKADSDGDGLSDGDEILKHKTNPLSKDSDNGTVEDGVEVKRGTNPLNADDDLEKEEKIKGAVGTQIVLEGIVFDTGKATLRPESTETLDKVAKTLMENPDIAIEIAGHTDNTGRRAANMKLSQARADAVADYLASKGVDRSQLATKGFGPDVPVASNDTPEGRQQNRRISFTRTK